MSIHCPAFRELMTPHASSQVDRPRACLHCARAPRRLIICGADKETDQPRELSDVSKAPPASSSANPPGETTKGGEEGEEETYSAGVSVALGMLRFYKTQISPLLPGACRFLPTCSQYAAEAYKKHGVAKGTVLTAWRLLRCTPFGGAGYDPVMWPPPRWPGGDWYD